MLNMKEGNYKKIKGSRGPGSKESRFSLDYVFHSNP